MMFNGEPGILGAVSAARASLGGMYQRLDNFLSKGFEDSITSQREKARQEKEEIETINTSLGKEFPQKAELDLVRENHAAVIRELQRMQDDSGYISEWKPKGMKDIVISNDFMIQNDTTIQKHFKMI